MRKRLTPAQRRAEILEKARALIVERGLAHTEMEDIRLACGMSRGGLYHHFGNKRAVLNALVADDVSQLVENLGADGGPTIPRLLRAGSRHLGDQDDLLDGMHTTEDRLEYLSSLELALNDRMRDALADRLGQEVRSGVNAAHVAELFVTINAQINRRELLGDWTTPQAADFAATALTAICPFFHDQSELQLAIEELREVART